MEKWYIIHTRPRWEKKLTDILEQKGIESFCPVKTLKRKWSDRVKKIEEPLFKCYLFVKIIPEQKMAVRLTEGVINFIYKDGKPALVKEKEMKAFKKLLDAGISMTSMEQNTVFRQVEEAESNRQRKACQFYLNSFTSRFVPSVDNSKLVQRSII
ncbi:MAG TPA: transcription termination/antitermination NusG family protein [Flavisolibacter sp.]|jgi:transcription antitermination factor NusG|nr:transcription termination/antitermination NusG family protein [Flavisolibacter sp.]